MENGLLIPVGNAEAIVIAVKRLLDDHSLRDRLAQRGREIVEQEFSAEIISDLTLDMYTRALNRSN